MTMNPKKGCRHSSDDGVGLATFIVSCVLLMALIIAVAHLSIYIMTGEVMF